MISPSEIISVETGILDIETQVAKKQIIYHRIRTPKNSESQIFKTIMNPKNPWRKLVENTMRESKINEEDILAKKQPEAKRHITKKL